MNYEHNRLLNNGVTIPVIGYGTYLLANNSDTTDLIKEAINIGYRHIDTATAYQNEEAIGKGIKESKFPREDIFLVSKVWNTSQGYDATIKAFNLSLAKLGTDYLDLYLIHWPKVLSKETWKAFEYLYKKKQIRTIGISNFSENQIDNLLADAEIKPMVNQVELHPFFAQKSLSGFCNNKSIQLEAWSPLMQGYVSKVSLLNELATKYKKSTAQIVLRWNIQLGIVPIPKASKIDHLKNNFDIFDFEITQDDMELINHLDCGKRIGPDLKNQLEKS